MENISKHITYSEATVSQTALQKKIPNIPNSETLKKMKVVATKCFEPLREWYGKPIHINSFFRSISLNKAVGGAKNSQHTLGEAIDISGGNKVENKKIFDWAKENLEFDQLINEYDYTWVHVSYRSLGNRNQILNIG